MQQHTLLRLLYPQTHPYALLNLEALPVLVTISLRFLSGDIKKLNAAAIVNADNEIRRHDYYRYRFKDGLDGERLFWTDSLLSILGYRKGGRGKSRKRFIEEYGAFITAQHKRIKKNLQIPFYQKNVISMGRLSFTLCLGACFIKHTYGSTHLWADAFMKEVQALEKRYDPVVLMRYLMNGARAEFWPYDTSFKGQRELLYSNAGKYLELIGRKTGMKDVRIDNLCAMILAGMDVEVRKEKAINEKNQHGNSGAYQLGLYAT